MLGSVKIYNDGSHYIGIPSNNFDKSNGLKGCKKVKKEYKEIVVREEFEDSDFSADIGVKFEQSNFLDDYSKKEEKSKNTPKKG